MLYWKKEPGAHGSRQNERLYRSLALALAVYLVSVQASKFVTCITLTMAVCVQLKLQKVQTSV